MAVTKIKPIKSTLSKALAYIQNPAKTDEKMLVSSFGCSYETADIEFAYTLSQALEKGNNLAHHLMQSFEPGEVSYEKAHEIGRQLADAVTKGQYEYVLTTHIDKGHIHNHVIFCAVNFIDHRKYNSNKRSYYGIRNISDRLCRENGLSVVVPGRGSKGKSYAEYQAEKTGTSWKGKLKIAVDALIPQASDFADFLRLLQAAGYEIKPGKYISCRAPGQERFTRLKTLGADYTEEAITERIKGRRTRAAKAPKQERGGISLVIDIQNSIKAQESRGYEHWAKIHNLKQAARTLNFLTENRIDSYAELSAKIAEVNAACEVVPKYAGCVNGVQWFKDRGQWIDGSAEPVPGMIIFFDWDNKGSSGPQDGQSDHTGIVQKVENGIVYTVEGNSGDSCRVNQYSVGHYEILGYGVPNY